MLNTRLQVTSHRRIGVDESLRVVCETGALRILPKGIELDLTSAVQADHETVWESLHTFYYRGKFGEGDSSHFEQPELSPISEPKTLASWYLPDGIGFRFARISGDSNGIHYSSSYARLFGFKRDFAQPLLILSKSLSCFSDFDPSRFRLLALFKGPAYYKSNVTLKGNLLSLLHSAADQLPLPGPLPIIATQRQLRLLHLLLTRRLLWL